VTTRVASRSWIKLHRDLLSVHCFPFVNYCSTMSLLPWTVYVASIHCWQVDTTQHCWQVHVDTSLIPRLHVSTSGCRKQIRRGKTGEIWLHAMTSVRQRVDIRRPVPNCNNSHMHLTIPGIANKNGIDAGLRTF